MQLLTLGWLVKELTEGSLNSAFLVIGVGGAIALPGIFVGPLGGVIGDKVNRRHVVTFLASIMALSAFSFAWIYQLGYMNIWYVYAYSWSCLPLKGLFLSRNVTKILMEAQL